MSDKAELDKAIRRFYPGGGSRRVSIACPGYLPHEITSRAYALGVKTTPLAREHLRDVYGDAQTGLMGDREARRQSKK